MIKSAEAWGRTQGLTRSTTWRLVHLLYPERERTEVFTDDQERALVAAVALWNAGVDSLTIRHAALAEVAKPGDYLVISGDVAQTCSVDLLAEIVRDTLLYAEKPGVITICPLT